MTARPTIHTYFMNIAKVVATRSTCLRHHVGAVIVRDNHIITTGFNGAPSGTPHCLDIGCIRDQENIPSGTRTERCVSGDTIIKLLNGTYKTIKELYDEKQNNINIYSIDTTTGQLVPGIATDIRISGYVNSLYEITLDNNYTLKCTPEHKIMMRDCSYKQAKNLKLGDSLMPMYYNFAVNDGYESIANTVKTRIEGANMKNYSGITRTIPTHHLVYFNHNNIIELNNEYVIHHIDKDILNNIPNNLKLMLRSEHSKLHTTDNPLMDSEFYKMIGALGIKKFKEHLTTDDIFRESVATRGRENMTNNWNDENFREKMKDINIENGKKTANKTNSDPEIIKLRNIGRILKGISSLEFRSGIKLNVDNYIEIRSKYIIRRRFGEKGSSPPTINFILKYFNSIDEAIKQSRTYNHKVKKIEIGKVNNESVYDMTVPIYENFAIDLGDNSCIFLHNCKSVHAEINAIIQAALHGVSTKGATLYCSHQPCSSCAKAIINAGIVAVVYEIDYPDDVTIKLFNSANIELIKLIV